MVNCLINSSEDMFLFHSRELDRKYYARRKYVLLQKHANKINRARSYKSIQSDTRIAQLKIFVFPPFVATMKIYLSIVVCFLTSTEFRPGCYGSPLLPQPVILSGVDLNWPYQDTKNIYEDSGRYIARNVIATRAQIYQDQAILALPRLRPGVPFTLGILPLKSSNHGSSISPFPCLPIQEEGNCQALQSAVDVVLDLQDILWVLDTGIVNTLEQPVRRCPPKVVGIDVKSGKVVKVINLDPYACPDSRFQYMVIDYDGDGNVFIYISDAGMNAIVVHNAVTDNGYRVNLPEAVTSGCNKPDALYLALVRRTNSNSVVLYFTYLNSNKVFAIEAQNLRNGSSDGTIMNVGEKKNQIVVLGTDNGSAIFYRVKGDSAIYMWNTDTPFDQKNFLLVKRTEDCRLPTAVIPGAEDLMWVLESNFQDYIDDNVSCSGASVVLRPLMNSCVT